MAPGDNGLVNDLPRRAASRTVRLAGLPLGYAGRATLGLGRRLGGRPAEIVAAEVQARTAEQLFKVLGELKGGAMKFGQAMSVFEAALPENLAGPYRETLTKLQDAAPPLPAASVHRVLARELGADWRTLFTSFNDTPAAAASIGQVHRAVWADGREVAVKVQYPGAGQALLSDLNQIGRMSRLVGIIVPGLEVKPLVAELKARVAEELDYRLEAESQSRFAAAFDGDSDVLVPKVVHGTGQVLVSEWVDGIPMSRIVSRGTRAQRDRAGLLLTRFLFTGPTRAGLLHADPHPGNFRLSEDNRLVVLDYGAVNRLPDGLPAPIGSLLRKAVDGDAQGVFDGLADEGFVRRGVNLDADRLLGYLEPILEPAQAQTFRFSRSWLRAQALRFGDPRSPAYSTGLQLNLPPEYLLIHRVTAGTIGVLCQLEAEGHWRAELESLLPGFASPPPRRRKPAAPKTSVADTATPAGKTARPKKTAKPAT